MIRCFYIGTAQSNILAHGTYYTPIRISEWYDHRFHVRDEITVGVSMHYTSLISFCLNLAVYLLMPKSVKKK